MNLAKFAIMAATAAMLAPCAYAAQTGTGAAAKESKLLIYGHVYDTDKNHPLKNMRVFVRKDGRELMSWKTDESGLYQLTGGNREDFLNLCAESTEFSKLKNVSVCETVSVFQKVWAVIDGVEVRELEHDFFTNAKGENLNQALVDEKTNEEDERAFGEYERNVEAAKEREETEAAKAEAEKRADEEKAKYRMPANTEMTWPLKNMQVVVSVTNGKTGSGSSSSWVLLIPGETVLKVYDHQGRLLKETKLSKLYEANFTVFPKYGPVFLNPAVLKVANSQTKVLDGKVVPAFREAEFLLSKEKNFVNFELPENFPWTMDRTVEKRERFPLAELLVLAALLATVAYAAMENRTGNLRNDY